MKQLRLLLYVVFGIGLVLAVAGTIIFNLTRVRVESAFVSAKTFTLTSPVSGRVSDIACTEGRFTKEYSEGDGLIRVENEALKQKLIDFNSQIGQGALAIKTLEKELKQKIEGLKFKENFYTSKRKNLEKQVEVSKQFLEKKKKFLETARGLERKGIRNLTKEAEREVNEAEISLLEKEDLLNDVVNVLKGIGRGQIFDAKKGVVHTFVLKDEEEKITELWRIHNNKVTAVTALQGSLDIRSPEAGKIVKIFVQPDTFVKQGDPLIRIESETDKTIKVLLTGDEYLKSNPRSGSRASVYFPSLSKRVNGRIDSVDTTGIEAEDLKEVGQVVGPDPNASVVVSIDVSKELLGTVAAGTPVRVTFDRKRSIPATPRENTATGLPLKQ